MNGFRVWDLEKEKMYYDEFFMGTSGELYKLESYTNTDETHYSLHLKPAIMRLCIIMRCSGIEDSSGQLIYENDIIECPDKRKYLIKYDDENGFYATSKTENFVHLSELGKFINTGILINGRDYKIKEQ